MRNKLILITFASFYLLSISPALNAQTVRLESLKPSIPKEARVNLWETPKGIQYKRGSYSIAMHPKESWSEHIPKFRLSVSDEKTGHKITTSDESCTASSWVVFSLQLGVAPVRNPKSGAAIYLETHDFSALNIEGLIKAAQEAIVDQCPAIPDIRIRMGNRNYLSGSGTNNVGSLTAEDNWSTFRVAQLPLRVKVGDNTTIAEEESSADETDSINARGSSKYNYGGVNRHAGISFSSKCDRQMTATIFENPIRNQGVNTNYDKYSGDISGDDFPFKPSVDALADIAQQKCEQVDILEIELSWRNSQNVGTKKYLYAHKKDDWKIVDGLGTECRTTPFDPPDNEHGILPVRDACPHEYLSENDEAITPKRDWSIYVRNMPINYGLTRSQSDNNYIMTTSSIAKCPNGLVDMDLIVDPEDFGGSENVVSNIRSILHSRDYEEPLYRFTYRFMNVFNFCHEDAPNNKLPHFAYRIISKFAPNKTLDVVDFFHLGEEGIKNENLPVIAGDAHPVIVKRREVERKTRELRTSGAFSNYQGGLYLSAIHAGEFDVLTAIDKETGTPIRNLLKSLGAADMMAEIGSIFTFQPGRRDEMREALEVIFSEYTLSHSAMATYVLYFGDIYQACLGPDPAGKKIITEVQEFLSDGSGFNIPIGPVSRSEKTFFAKRELREMLFFYGDKEGMSVSGLANRVFNGDSENSVISVNEGVLKMMQSHPCDSPKIRQFEKNLIKFWTDRQKRVKPHTDRLRFN